MDRDVALNHVRDFLIGKKGMDSEVYEAIRIMYISSPVANVRADKNAA